MIQFCNFPRISTTLNLTKWTGFSKCYVISLFLWAVISQFTFADLILIFLQVCFFRRSCENPMLQLAHRLDESFYSFWKTKMVRLNFIRLLFGFFCLYLIVIINWLVVRCGVLSPRIFLVLDNISFVAWNLSWWWSCPCELLRWLVISSWRLTRLSW